MRSHFTERSLRTASMRAPAAARNDLRPSQIAIAGCDDSTSTATQVRRGHHRTGEQGVRIAGDDGDRLGVGPHHRTAGRERVRGRSGGRRDQDTVGTERRDRPPVDLGDQFQHTPVRVVLHDDLVECQVRATVTPSGPTTATSRSCGARSCSASTRRSSPRRSIPPRPRRGMWPRLIPSTGTSAGWTSSAARRKVPSPPSAMTTTSAPRAAIHRARRARRFAQCRQALKIDPGAPRGRVCRCRLCAAPRRRRRSVARSPQSGGEFIATGMRDDDERTGVGPLHVAHSAVLTVALSRSLSSPGDRLDYCGPAAHYLVDQGRRRLRDRTRGRCPPAYRGPPTGRPATAGESRQLVVVAFAGQPRKYSTLPDGPGSGEAPASRSLNPSAAAHCATTKHRGGAQLRSRTTPPAPTRSLPTSNCGLTIGTRSPPGQYEAASAGGPAVTR